MWNFKFKNRKKSSVVYYTILNTYSPVIGIVYLYRIGHCNGCIKLKFKFNNKLLHMKNDSVRCQRVAFIFKDVL